MATLLEYSDSLFAPRKPDIFDQLVEDARRDGLPTIHIPDDVGRLLQILIGISGAKRILELGTLFGYSAAWMAQVLPPDGRIVTLEGEPRHAAAARRNLDRAGLGHLVEIRQGPALDILPALEGQTFDLAFIDADKDNY
ncbi:MAG: class I SAM-dependent methyltransferase, partial [Chloroflexi bacterium]|nr:class I SAM-dependent methyltransferase [Chloroflexota bacterium]